jgi:hypothetical protein
VFWGGGVVWGGDGDWFGDTCRDGIVGVSCTEVLPLPNECRPREVEVFPPLFAPLPDI